MNKGFIYGADIGSLLELEQKGIIFQEKENKPEDLLVILKRAGFKSIRLRLWNDPKSNDGKPYGGGNNDFLKTLTLAKRALSVGFSLVLDFHYSDFWADPGKQWLPKAWRHLSLSGLVDEIYDYTKKVLTEFKNEGVFFSYVQVGNEITNGMLWPHGKLYDGDKPCKKGFLNLSALLNSAYKAVNEVMPRSKIILHLDRGGDKDMYDHFFTKMIPLLTPFAIIGLSYYPYWHGTLADLKGNISNLQTKFKQKIMIMETSYAYTGMQKEAPFVVTNEKTPRPAGFPPFSREGQYEFLKSLLLLAREMKIDGLFYWEPAWLEVRGDTWATKAGREYIKETNKEDGNEWANQALFDEKGKALPALFAYNHLKEEIK